MEPFWLIGVCPWGGVLAGRLLGNKEWVQLSRTEEPENRHWTVELGEVR
jgi:hypothetical protein